jgi:nicotinamide-nucleotide amidase
MSLFPADLVAHAEALLAEYRALGRKIVTAESCTGGLVAGLLTEIPGSSDVVERGFVTYSNEAKVQLLAVPKGLIAQHGAVSGPVAKAMAEGALIHSRADVAVAITGVAGPGGGSIAKPVGLVWFGVAAHSQPSQSVDMRYGDLGRTGIRLAAVETALKLLSQIA